MRKNQESVSVVVASEPLTNTEKRCVVRYMYEDILLIARNALIIKSRPNICRRWKLDFQRVKRKVSDSIEVL